VHPGIEPVAEDLARPTRIGDAYDNALAESFVDSFKVELIKDRVWQTRSQLTEGLLGPAMS
jgi:hypothetical protein